MGFGVINIIGLDPTKAIMGDLAIKISHSGFEVQVLI
jgi:hypothetical protein